MSFQAYIDNIHAKTGKTPEDFLKLARKKGLLEPGVKAGEIVSWLKNDFDLGHGHSMAIVLTFREATGTLPDRDERIAKHFSGKKGRWKKSYDTLVARFSKLGPQFSVGPTDTYISLLRDGRKFGIVQASADRFDVGIKLKGVKAAGRLEDAGEWNRMVTHRVRVSDPKEIDRELIGFLSQAYKKA